MNIKLHTYRYTPKEKSRAIIFIFHGLNAHMGQAAHIARIFSMHGFISVGFDHRGFGKS